MTTKIPNTEEAYLRGSLAACIDDINAALTRSANIANQAVAAGTRGNPERMLGELARLEGHRLELKHLLQIGATLLQQIIQLQPTPLRGK